MASSVSSPVARILAERTAPAASELVRDLGDGRLRCLACGHRCPIPNGASGVCKVRFNEDGVLRVPHGYVGALQCDPIEKKPFFHAMPGSLALSFGMLGCDLHCAYCQNWFTSQSIRDPRAAGTPRDVEAGELPALAAQFGASVLASTYNEPLITSEWAVQVFREAQGRGLKCAYISNGNATPEVLAYIRPFVDFYKVDLKSMNDRHYRELGGVLNNVLDSIRNIHRMGFWLECLTLIIPGFNDSDAELRDAAQFIASLSPDIPWHVTAFHPDYKMDTTPPTPASTLLRACEIGAGEGLRYIYAGNLPGLVGPWEDTRCPTCGDTLVERTGFFVRRNRIPEGICPRCGTSIPGRWQGGGVTRSGGVPLPVRLGARTS
jgi:pyruvate formate lyase activating enzyme